MSSPFQVGNIFRVKGYQGYYKLIDDRGLDIVLQHTKSPHTITLYQNEYDKLTPVTTRSVPTRRPTTTSSTSSYYQPISTYMNTNVNMIPENKFQVGNLVQLSDGRRGKVKAVPVLGDSIKVQLNNSSILYENKSSLQKIQTPTTTTTSSYIPPPITTRQKYVVTVKHPTTRMPPPTTTTSTYVPPPTTTTPSGAYTYNNPYAPWNYNTSDPNEDIPWLKNISSTLPYAEFQEGNIVNLKYSIDNVKSGFIFAKWDANQASINTEYGSTSDSPYYQPIQGPIYIIRDTQSPKYIYSPAINLEFSSNYTGSYPSFDFPKGKLVRINWPQNPNVHGLLARTTEHVTTWKANVFINDPEARVRNVSVKCNVPSELLTPVYQYPTTPSPTARKTHQLLFVSHGNAKLDRFGRQLLFTMPDNIELVHFETSNDSISFITADVVIEKLHDMFPEYTINNGSEQIYVGKWNGNPRLTATDGQYRISVHAPNSTTAENFGLELRDTSSQIIHDAIGFYDTDHAYIDFQTVLGGFPPPNPPTTGKDNILTHEFFTSLPAWPNTDVQTLVTFVSQKYSISHPGQVIRLFLICCRIGHTVLRPVVGTGTNLQNISDYPSLGGRRRAKKGRKQTRRRRGSRRRGSRSRRN